MEELILSCVVPVVLLEKETNVISLYIVKTQLYLLVV